jgi:hypothetical protein
MHKGRASAGTATFSKFLDFSMPHLLVRVPGSFTCVSFYYRRSQNDVDLLANSIEVHGRTWSGIC